jgi:hypothetical protein
MTELDDDQWLGLYLEEALDPQRMAWIENRLREEPLLNQRLDRLRRDPTPSTAHSIGMAWVAGRLTCPTRTQWTKHLNGLLDQALSDYLKFHLEVIECPFCQANVIDLQKRATITADAGELADRSARAAGWSKSATDSQHES